MAIRFVSCFLCGTGAGLCIRYFYRGKSYFDFKGFEASTGRDTDPNLLLRFLKNLGRNIKATGPWFLFGVLLSALFQRYVPAEAFGRLFGENKGFGVLMAATVGVPLYACGGGTIPLLQQWLVSGMSMGSASAFMITGRIQDAADLAANENSYHPVREYLMSLAWDGTEPNGYVSACGTFWGLLTMIIFLNPCGCSFWEPVCAKSHKRHLISAVQSDCCCHKIKLSAFHDFLTFPHFRFVCFFCVNGYCYAIERNGPWELRWIILKFQVAAGCASVYNGSGEAKIRCSVLERAEKKIYDIAYRVHKNFWCQGSA